jgi:hypothetical protein
VEREYRRHDLKQGLLQQSVEHRGDAERPYPLPSGLRDFHLPHRLGMVRAAPQFLADAQPMLAQVRIELVYGHPVDARCTCVALHAR